MRYETTEAVRHPDRTVTVAWFDGVLGVVRFAPLLPRAGLRQDAFLPRRPVKTPRRLQRRRTRGCGVILHPDWRPDRF